MLRLSSLLTVLLFSTATPALAAELLLSVPQDEHLDPTSTQSVSVRPGAKVSLVAALYDRIEERGFLDKGRRADEFHWQPSCDSSSPACPTISTTAGSVVVTINIPICMPLGATIVTVSMPVPPEGESIPSPATVTLNNTEAPSICPGGNNVRPGVNVAMAAVQATPEAEASAAGAQGGIGGGSGHGRAGADPRKIDQRRAWLEANGFEEPVYSNGSQRGYNYGEQSASAYVVSCGYKRNRLLCRQFESAKKQKVRKVKAKRKVKSRRR